MKTIGLFCVLMMFGFLPAQTLVKDINTGTNGSSPVFQGSISRGLVFSATTSTYGNEYWITDGTNTGTFMLKDIRPGFATSVVFSSSVVTNDMIYMVVADTMPVSYSLWRTDGTTSGTFQLMKFSSSMPIPDISKNELCGVNGKCIFSYGSSSNNKEIWVSDGTVAGTRQLKDIYPGASAGSNPYNLVATKNHVYFFADDGVHGYELWRTDGTDTGTILVKDVFPGSISSLQNIAQKTNMVASENKVWFSAISDVVTGFELFVSDGTDTGTRLVKDLNPIPYLNSSCFVAGASDQLTLVFFRNDTGNWLCATDGTDNGTVIVSDSNFTSIPNTRNYIVSGNQIFFVHTEQATGTELWSSDGTKSGTGLLIDLSPGTASGATGIMCSDNGKVYFAGSNNIIGRELFVSTGFKGRTELYIDMFPGVFSGHFASIMMHQGKLYASANDNSGKGTELYQFDLLTSIDKTMYSSSNWSIWPNPVRAGSTLGNISEDVTQLTLFSSTGEMITLYRHSDKTFTLPDYLSAGIYVLSTGEQTSKLVIEQ